MASTNIGVNLDELVLAGIASHLHFIDRIFQELVSRRFAISLQMANESSKISLTINKDWMKISTSQYTFVQEKLPEEDTTTILRKQFCAPGNELTEAFAVLFARFKRYRMIEITDTVTDSILAVISKEALRPIQLIHLKYTFYKAVDVESSDSESSDFRLIETLSPLIKNLTLQCSMPKTEAGSKKLWASVADCKNLQKLSFFPKNAPARLRPKPDVFSNVHLCECLKVRKIRHFRSGYGARSYGSHWLAEAFKDNENLRKLFIDDDSLRLNTFTNPAVLPIISRLRTLGMDFSRFDSPDAQAGDIVKILCALKANGYPTVSQQLDYSAYLSYEVVMDITDDPLTELKELEEALKFWLKMSDQTVCFVKLCLTLFTPPISITNWAINALQGTAEFGDLVVEQKSNRTILRHKNARIQLSICNEKDDMPIKIFFDPDQFL